MATRITNQKLSKSSRAWMREHLDDPFVKKAQKEGYRARAAYKLLEIQEKYKIINEVEIYVKEFAKQNNIKVVGSYNPHLLNLKNEHFFDGMHSLDIAYEIIFKDLLK